MECEALLEYSPLQIVHCSKCTLCHLFAILQQHLPSVANCDHIEKFLQGIFQK